MAVFVMLVGSSGCRNDAEPTGTQEPQAASANKAGSPGALPVLGAAPSFSLTDQSGRSFGSDDLQGAIWLANFIFTRCEATCPMQTAQLAALHANTADDEALNDVQFVSFSVDPEYDTPPVLKAYSEKYGADPDRWRFVTGAREEIWQLSTQGFKLATGEAPADAASPLFHATQVALVDGQGRIRGYYDGLTAEGIEHLNRDMLALITQAVTTDAGDAGQSMSTHARQIADPAQIAIPPDVFATDWVATRRAEQLAARSSLTVFCDFSFEDRSIDSGILFDHHIVDDAGKTYKSAHYDHGNGVVTADVDGDGFYDLYFVSQVGRNELWRNRGDGSFEDITAQAGVDVTDPIGATASFADTDNDGDPDLYVTTVRGGNFFFRNDGGGRFTDLSAESGLQYSGHSSSPVFFDYDNDGFLDCYLANVGEYTSDRKRSTTMLNRDGIEETYEFYSAHEDAFAGHLKPDRDETSRLYRNLGDNHFADVTETVGLLDAAYCGDATPLDVNADGWLDLYVLNMQGHDEYYENVGGEHFVRKSREVFPSTPWGSMGVKSFDFDNDGLLDLYITDMHSDMSEEVGPPAEKMKSDMQWPESLLRSGGNSIYGNGFFRGLGNGRFEEVSDAIGAENYWPWGLSVGDLNADGFEDVFIASSMNYPFRYGVNSVLLNDHGDRFVDSEYILGVEPRLEDATAKPWFTLECGGDDWGHRECEGRDGTIVIWGALGSRSSVIFDLDNDGDLDIVTNEFNDGPMVLLSDLSQRRPLNYIKVTLDGSTSNRSGLGATVTVYAGAARYVKVNDGKSGYLSQSDYPLYFGLDEATQVDRIEVNWPGGDLQTINGPIASGALLDIQQQQ